MGAQMREVCHGNEPSAVSTWTADARVLAALRNLSGMSYSATSPSSRTILTAASTYAPSLPSSYTPSPSCRSVTSATFMPQFNSKREGLVVPKHDEYLEPAGSYLSVARMLVALRVACPPEVTVRLSFKPRETDQVGFGTGPVLMHPDNAQRRT